MEDIIEHQAYHSPPLADKFCPLCLFLVCALNARGFGIRWVMYVLDCRFCVAGDFRAEVVVLCCHDGEEQSEEDEALCKDSIRRHIRERVIVTEPGSEPSSLNSDGGGPRTFVIARLQVGVCLTPANHVYFATSSDASEQRLTVSDDASAWPESPSRSA